MLRLPIGLAAAAAMVLLVSAGGVSGCGSASAGTSGFGSGSGADAGSSPDAPEDVTTDVNFGDSIAPDAPTDAPGDATGLPPPGVLFVHASPSLPNLRLCWTTNGSFAGDQNLPFPSATPMPASNYPGLPIGGAVPLGDASSMLGGAVTIYVLDADRLALLEQQDGKHSCAERLTKGGTYGLLPGEYFALPPIADGTITTGSTYVIGIAGCLGNDPTANPARCGAGWTASNGNLHIDLATVANAAGPAQPGQLAVQAAQLSPALAALAGDAGALVSFGAQGAMGAVVAQLIAEQQVAPAVPALLDAGTNLTTYGTTGFSVDVAGDAGVHLWMSLAQSLDLVDPTQDPSKYFAQPTSYVVTVIGDPAGAPPGGNPDAAYDGTGLHLLVLPQP
jgi:hypothetical protein